MKTLPLSQAKVALVYDRVNTRYGGAEQVLLAVHELFPMAPLFTSVYDEQQAIWANRFQVVPSFLQKIPLAKKFRRWFVPLMPLAFESLDLREYDLVISITSAEAKGVLTSPSALHVCYLLTPPRYLWSHHHQYSGGFFSLFQELLFSKLRTWDYVSGQRPDVMIPISKLVAKRCHKYYRRSTEPVIYPPVSLPTEKALEKQRAAQPPDTNYFLVVSRLVSYKNVDVIIHACVQTQQKLVIIGDGPEKHRIQQIIQQLQAQSLIHIVERCNQTQLDTYYQGCNALVMMAEEDFGIVALEAQAHGKPVIVYQHSGAAEVVIDGKTGVHIPNSQAETIASTLKSFTTKKWSSGTIRKHATQFSTTHFQTQFFEKIEKLWNNHALAYNKH